MTPSNKYAQDQQLPGFVYDPVQAQAVRLTQDLFEHLLTVSAPSPRKGIFGFWQRQRKVEPSGLFLHGGVGRGKSYVADSLFECVPFPEKMRKHFHRFMLDVHQQLKLLSQTPDPLQVVAERLARGVRLLVLDEFHVNDVADAMLLVGLLPALHQQQVSLVLTSNYAPDDLYRNGLQRERFLTVIKFIHRNLRVFDFGDGCDYRSLLILRDGVGHTVERSHHQELLAREFSHLTPGGTGQTRCLQVNGRALPVQGSANGVLWVDFAELCQAPRSNADYLELACQYHTVLSGWIPVMNRYHDDVMRRFIHMVDIFYDHNVKFIFTAQAQPDALYQDGQLVPSYQRTISRLHEMCSPEYLSLPHRAA